MNGKLVRFFVSFHVRFIIKFELVYSESSLNVLDLTLLLQDGFISTDIYSKPTDSHLYLPHNSSHPDHCKKAISYGVALRIRRNCSTNASFVKRCSEYKSYLKQQNYNGNLVDKQFEKAMQLERSDVLKPKTKTKKKTFPLVVDYNPRLPNISLIIKKHFHLQACFVVAHLSGDLMRINFTIAIPYFT